MPSLKYLLAPGFLLAALLCNAVHASPHAEFPGLPDGLYRLQTAAAPSPVLMLDKGRVVRSAGFLEDAGCAMRRNGSLQQKISLTRLFAEQETTRNKEHALANPSYHSNQWQGENPFAFSKVSLSMNEEARLELTHTVVTYVVNADGRGTTLCNRHHHYQMLRLN